MDAFAVAVCKGLSMRRINYRQAFIIALAFGGFQALMPIAGWLLGSTFSGYIESVDHWIAFILLSFIGAKMIADAVKEYKEGLSIEANDPPLNLLELLLLAIATSIDALAVGITFSLLSVRIALAVTTIGITTFILSFAGVAVGNRFGGKFRTPAQVAGGIILMGLGIRILISHIFFGG